MSHRGRHGPGAILLALFALGCASSSPAAVAPAASAATPAAAPRVLVYDVTVGAALERLDVRLCVEGPRPRQLMAASRDMIDGLTRLAIEGPGGSRSLPVGRSPVDLGALGPDDCIAYTVAIADFGGFVPAMQRIGDTLLTDTRAWLWRPRRWNQDTRVVANVHLPHGMSASLPWRRQGTRFESDASALGFAGNAAFGRLELERFTEAGAQVEVVVPPGLGPQTRAAVAPWITSAVRATAGAIGRFPTDRLQVVLVPRRHMADPIGFGLMRRGGGASARLVVSSDAELVALKRAWTAIHEFSHLLHHFVDKRDAWLSEGIATYYQEVLRVRAGLLPPQQAWQRIHSGAAKGRQTDRSLRQDSARMFAEGNFSRVYWGGAAMALLADVALRSRRDSPSTLDDALGQLTRCCGVIARPWSCARTMGELDRLTGGQVFSDLLERAQSGRMPDLGPTFERLGISVDDEGRVHLRDAPLSHVRDAIMAPRQPR